MTHTVEENPQIHITQPTSFSVQQQETQLTAPWWESLNRPALSTLIDQSLSQNFDIIKAIAVLEQAQATAKKTSVVKLPQINLESDTSRDWQGSDDQRGDAKIGATLSWELDIWNRIGNATKADLKEVQARKAEIDVVKLSLSAEVANAYFGAVAAHAQIALLEQQLNLDRELENLLQLRRKNGVGNNVDVLQQQARVADSEALIPVAQSNLAVFENRLDILLGQIPDATPRIPQNDTLSFEENLPPISIPSALLLNRPDLEAARAELVAADADIGAAIADRLPRIMLDGSYVFQDAASFTGPVSMITGTFIQPLLDWGQRKAEVERNKALYRERLAAYTQLFLEAVEDVENALVQEQKQRNFIEKLELQKDILQRATNAAEQRYKQGVDNYQPVITATRELRDIERNLVQEKLNLINFRIDLHRAIGGPIHSTSSKEL